MKQHASGLNRQQGLQMFRNYAATAVRTLLKNKLFSLINIFGLAIGLAASILILLFVRYELSYESWLPNADNVYRMSSVWKNDGDPSGQGAWVPGPLRQALFDEFPEVENVTRVSGRRMVFKRGDALFNEIVSRVDPGFFEVFQMDFIAGDPSRVLATTNSIAMSEETAFKYFGDDDPIGKTVSADSETIYEVVAIFKDVPENSELDFDIISLFDIPGIKERHYFDDWDSTTLQMYFTIDEGADIDLMMARMDEVLIRIIPDDTPETPYTDNQSFVALAVSDAHLLGTTGDDYMPGGGMKTVFTFIIVAMLVVGVAVFNFVNSSTAVAQLRAKEVAMRKTLGAGRRQLMRQFLGESALIVFLAFVVALILVELALLAFRDFWDKDISADYLGDPVLFGGLLAMFPIVVFAAGYYPAVYLTKFRPAATLMSNRSSGGEKARLRKALVLVQFAVSVGLAIVATIIQSQFEFATTQELGFDRENKIIVRGIGSDAVAARYASLEQEMERLPGVRSMARSYYAIGDGNWSGRSVTADWLDATPHGVKISPIDFGFFELYNIPIIAGRTFDESYANDIFSPLEVSEDDEDSTVDASAIISRSALARLEIGSAQEALGKTIYIEIDDGLSRGAFTIIGVVEDYKERNVREAVASAVFFVYPEYFANATISLYPGSLPGVLAEIENVWSSVYPDIPIRHEFLDEKLDKMYATAQRRAQMLFAFAILAIVISALGLYGLASFTAVRRTKEVGIRKVMGASAFDITRMMVGQFSIPVLLANMIAWPVAWYIATDWLEGFEYRIDIAPTIFIIYGAGALLLAWFTVGAHAWKVARTNPVHALRYE
jgi:putative ABC transport system permease protein